MTLTRDFKQTVAERVRRDPAFANALLDEAATLFLNGEPHTARLTLRDLVSATVGPKRAGRQARQTQQEPSLYVVKEGQSAGGLKATE